MKHRVAAAVLTACLLLSLLVVPAAAAGRYSDVPQGDWAEEVIQKATEYGLIEGKGDGTFGYGEYMNRASFVTVLCRLFGWDMVTPDKPSFSDCDPGAWYYSAVETALANGAIDSGLYFRPNDDISRQDMAIMLVRALGYENLAMTQASAELPFSDVTENQGVHRPGLCVWHHQRRQAGRRQPELPARPLLHPPGGGGPCWCGCTTSTTRTSTSSTASTP